MKKFTKSDVADIALLVMGLKFLLDLIRWTFVSIAQGIEAPYEGADIWRIVILIACGAVVYLLLFRRSFLIRLVFSDSTESELEVGEGLFVLTTYAFWVRLLGIMMFLSSGIAFIGETAWGLADGLSLTSASFGWMHAEVNLVSLILSFLMILKAEWIAAKLGKLGSSKVIGD